MKNHIIVPLVFLGTITTLTACTDSTTLPALPVVSTGTSVPDSVTPTISTGTSVTPTPASPISTTKTVSYGTPAGNESITFSVEVTDGTITSATSTVAATDRESVRYQERFGQKLASKVIGKSIKTFSVDTIA